MLKGRASVISVKRVAENFGVDPNEVAHEKVSKFSCMIPGLSLHRHITGWNYTPANINIIGERNFNL